MPWRIYVFKKRGRDKAMPRFIMHTDRRELVMFRTFFPDEYLDSTYVIDFEKLYAQGYRGDRKSVV